MAPLGSSSSLLPFYLPSPHSDILAGNEVLRPANQAAREAIAPWRAACTRFFTLYTRPRPAGPPPGESEDPPRALTVTCQRRLRRRRRSSAARRPHDRDEHDEHVTSTTSNCSARLLAAWGAGLTSPGTRRATAGLYGTAARASEVNIAAMALCFLVSCL